MSVLPTNPPARTNAHGRTESFGAVLKSLTGQVVTIVNPESLEDAPVGRHLTTGIYRAKILEVGSDFLMMSREYDHRHGDRDVEFIRQYLRLTCITRVSLMKEETLLHL